MPADEENEEIRKNRDRKKRNNRSLLFFGMVILLIVIVIMAVLIFPPTGDNTGNGDAVKGPWKDLSKFKSSMSDMPYFDYYDINGAVELDGIDEPKNSVYLLIGIESSMNSSELVAIGEYLDDGGHAIIADDGTNANRITDYLQGRIGSIVTFTGHRYLVDKAMAETGNDRGFVYNMSFIKGYNLPLKGEVYDLLYHSPNSIEYTEPGHPVLTTTKQLTVVDQNDNWQMDGQDIDKFKPYGEIAVSFDIGSNGGKVTFITTTGFFTDNVFDLYQNEQFIRGYVYTQIPQGGDVVLDISKQTQKYSPHIAVLPS